MKVCKRCRKRKPLSEFYAHKMMADGHLSFCKACVKARITQHRAANLDRIRAYDRARAKLPHRVAQATEITRRIRKANPGRYAANTKAERLHRTAPATCQMCGLEKRLERHHPDYSLPTMIVWLCKPCHAIADRKRA